MRYYLYVSDTKVDMLLGQIPVRILDRIATELKVDLKVISATWKNRDSESGGSRYDRLQALDKYLTENEDVGDPLSNSTWIRGTMAMRWASILGTEGDMIFFGGQDREKVVGLAGSRVHLVGMRGEGILDPPHPNSSDALMVLRSLEKWLAAAITVSDAHVKSRETAERSSLNAAIFPLSTVYHTVKGLVGPSQVTEFLGRRLLDGTIEGPGLEGKLPVVLATPLYVALAS